MDGKEISDHDLLLRIDEKVSNIRNDLCDHEDRLRKVEKWKERQIGAGLVGGVSGAGGGAVGGFLAAWLWFSRIFQGGGS